MKGIIKADDRLKQRPKINILMLGEHGVGKTTQARTLPSESSILIDLEAGTLAVGDWKGDVLPVRDLATNIGAHPWEMARALAVYFGGPDPADLDGAYSKAVYDQVCQALGDPTGPDGIAHIKTIFLDSITVASRWCFSWCQTQPEAFSEKTGKPDTRGAYGLMGREMVRWLTHLQHAPQSVIIACILDRFEDELKRVTFSPQIEGSKTGREIPGIFDEVVTLDYCYDEHGKALRDKDGEKVRAFYCHKDNIYGFPAKDRSGCLEGVEQPDLAALIEKISSRKRLDSNLKTKQSPVVA